MLRVSSLLKAFSDEQLVELGELILRSPRFDYDECVKWIARGKPLYWYVVGEYLWGMRDPNDEKILHRMRSVRILKVSYLYLLQGMEVMRRNGYVAPGIEIKKDQGIEASASAEFKRLLRNAKATAARWNRKIPDEHKNE